MKDETGKITQCDVDWFKRGLMIGFCVAFFPLTGLFWHALRANGIIVTW